MVNLITKSGNTNQLRLLKLKQSRHNPLTEGVQKQLRLSHKFSAGANA